MALDQFDVSFVPGSVAALLQNRSEPAEVARWSMKSLQVPDGYVAALVAEGQGWQLKSFAVDQFPGMSSPR